MFYDRWEPSCRLERRQKQRPVTNPTYRSGREKLQTWGRRQGQHHHHRYEGEDEGEGEGETRSFRAYTVSFKK